jgi:hypothetical protein
LREEVGSLRMDIGFLREKRSLLESKWGLKDRNKTWKKEVEPLYNKI